MKTRYALLIALLHCSYLSAAEPNDGGIGGTGRGDAPLNIDAFETPDGLDGLDIPLPTDQISDVPGSEDLGLPEVDAVTPDDTSVTTDTGVP